jgi:hypothetical protein
LHSKFNLKIILFSDNSIDLSLMECIEKEKFGYDRIDSTASNDQAVTPIDTAASDYATRKVLFVR